MNIMKREFLQNLGIEKDAVDQIMAENGKDIEAAKAKADALEKEKASLQESLDTAKETITGFEAKNLDVSTAQEAAENWKKQYEASEKARKAETKRNNLMQKLTSTNTVDIDLLSKCLKMDELIYKDGEFIGLETQLEAIKADKPYLFKDPNEKAKLKGAHIGESKDNPEDDADFSKMTYSEMTAYLAKHPEAAAKL